MNDIKLEKLTFINDNKEILKNSIMFKVECGNKSQMVILLLLKILLSNEKLEDMIEYEVLNNFVSTRIGMFKESAALADIFGTMKTFIFKYDGDSAISVIEKLNEYQNLEFGVQKKLLNKAI